MGERIQCKHAEVWLDEELGIIRVVTANNCTITLDDAKHEIAVIAKLSKGKRLPLLCDGRTAFIEQDAREFYGSDATRTVCRAVALLGPTPQTAAVHNMWTAAYDHPDTPSRVYFSESAAIEWLKEFVNKDEHG